MEKSPVLQKALWANVIFAEFSALAFLFLSSKLPFLGEMAGGQPILLGIELMVMACLATYAALRPAPSRFLIQLIVALNVLLFGYYVELLIWGPTVSALAKELLVIDAMVVDALIIAQAIGLRAASQKKKIALVS